MSEKIHKFNIVISEEWDVMRTEDLYVIFYWVK